MDKKPKGWLSIGGGPPIPVSDFTITCEPIGDIASVEGTVEMTISTRAWGRLWGAGPDIAVAIEVGGEPGQREATAMGPFPGPPGTYPSDNECGHCGCMAADFVPEESAG